MIVCLEGIDACGKGTHTELLVKRLSAKTWKFPNRNSPAGRLIYAHLEEKWSARGHPTYGTEKGDGAQLDAMVFQALQVANRMEVASEIFEAASRGNVVFDRYWPSGYAYGKADGLDGDYLIGLHSWLPQPDIFILLDIDPQDSGTRRPERRDRYEKTEGMMETVAGHYRTLWQARAIESPGRWVKIDARGSKENTAAAIYAAVAAYRERQAG